MSEQAAEGGRTYVVLEVVKDAPNTYLFVGKVVAASRDAAVRHQAGKNPEWTGGVLVAIPEGSWVPTPVRVETKRNVTLG